MTTHRRAALCLGAIACAVFAAAAAVAQSPSLSADDHASIQQLYARAALAFDAAEADGRGFAETFTADGVFVDIDGAEHRGRASLAALARRAGGRTSEFIYNVLVEPAPGGAAGKAYVVVTRPGAPGAPVTGVTAGQYHDTLVRTADGWRLARRTFVGTPGAPARVSR
jgi:hypothetical protein